MKNRKNLFLTVGIIVLNIPLIMRMYELAVSSEQMLTEDFLRLCGSVILHGLASLLAIAQFMCNYKEIRKPVLLVTGICVSSLFILFPILSLITALPQFLILDSLGIVMAKYTLSQVANLLSAVGSILLLTGYVQSLKRRK